MNATELLTLKHTEDELMVLKNLIRSIPDVSLNLERFLLSRMNLLRHHAAKTHDTDVKLSLIAQADALLDVMRSLFLEESETHKLGDHLNNPKV